MDLNRHDLTVIEQALHMVIKNAYDYQKVHTDASEGLTAGITDGFRYGYDDAADVNR